MEIRLKKFLSVFLIAIIGFTGVGNAYFFESELKFTSSETQIVSYSDLIPEFDHGLEFSSAKINVPGFKALDTVFDLINDASDFLFALEESGLLTISWLQNTNGFFSIHILLFPFHYFW